MGRFRARTAFIAFAMVAAVIMALHGQATDDRRLEILQNVGLPAVDEGSIQDRELTPSSAAARRRAALRDALLGDRVSTTGTRYRAGRVVVRFRDASAMEERRSAVRAASRTGEIVE